MSERPSFESKMHFINILLLLSGQSLFSLLKQHLLRNTKMINNSNVTVQEVTNNSIQQYNFSL